MKRLITTLVMLLAPFVASAQMVTNGDPAVIQSHGLTSLVTNAGTTGTTVNLLAKTSASGAVIATTSDTSIPVFLVVGGAGTSGSAQFLVAGQGLCVMDATNGSGASGWYVIESTTTNGRCHAQSSAPTGWIVGRLVDDATTSGSTATILVSPTFNISGAGSGTVTSIATTSPIGGGTITSSGTITCTTCTTNAASLTDKAIVIGSGGGQGTQTVAGLTTDGVSVITLGVAGTSVGEIDYKNATSGTIALKPVTGALGSVTLSLPARTATIGTTTGTLTNGNLVSFDSSGNSVDSGVVAANAVTAASNFANGGLVKAAGANKTLASADLTGAVTTSGGVATTLSTAYRYRTCTISVGDTSGSAITNAQLGPQKKICFVPAASTVTEVEVTADAGTPNVIVGRNRAGTTTNLLSSALATAASGAIACSNTGGTTGLDGTTTCSSTLQNTSTNAGDFFELVSGTAGGTAKFFTVNIVYTIN